MRNEQVGYRCINLQMRGEKQALSIAAQGFQAASHFGKLKISRQGNHATR